MQESTTYSEPYIHDESSQEDQASVDRKRVPFYSSRYQIPLSKIDKILKHHSSPIVNSLHLAQNLTFVAQVTYKKIQHYSSTGVLLFDHNFNKMINFIFMATKNIVIMFLRSITEADPDDEIVQLDLNTYEMISIPFKCELKQCAGAEIFTETQLFCIKQLKSYMKVFTSYTQKVKLTYFRYPLKKQGSQLIESDPVHVTYFDPDEGHQGQKMKIMKLNNKSMIGIVGENSLSSCGKRFLIFNPTETKDKWKEYFFDYELKVKPKKTQFYMDSAWEIQPEMLFVKFTLCPQSSSLDEVIQLEEERQLMKKERVMIFSWKYRSKKRAIQASNLTSNGQHFYHFPGQILSIDYATYLKQFVYESRLKKAHLKTRYPQTEAQILPTEVELPIFYLSNSNKTNIVTAIDPKKFRILLKNQSIQSQDTKLRSVPYSSLKYLEYSDHYDEQNNIQVLNIELKILKQLKYPIKIIAVHMLEDKIQNCDDDLLYYVTQMIEDDNQITYHQID